MQCVRPKPLSLSTPEYHSANSCTRIPTTGDGNCLIHALFGNFDPTRRKIFHGDAYEVRSRLADLLSQNLATHEDVREFLQPGPHVSISTHQRLSNFIATLRENGEFLGLEHVQLIAKACRINIRVYYPTRSNYGFTKIDLLYQDTNTQKVDRAIYFDGRNHWEKCELSHEPELPASLDFVKHSQSEMSTTASGPSLSPRSLCSEVSHVEPNPKYKKVFENPGPYSNKEALQSLAEKTKLAFNRSYLFEDGKQQEDEHFDQTFCDFYREMRGGERLINKTSHFLANRFRGYSDISRDASYTIDGGDYSDIECESYLPTKEFIDELKELLQKKYGLKKELFDAFSLNGKSLRKNLKLDSRDTFLTDVKVAAIGHAPKTAPVTTLPLSILSAAFPRTLKAYETIFQYLLASEWLKDDIEGIKLYLNEKSSIDRSPSPSLNDLEQAVRLWEQAHLWEQAKYCGDQQKLVDKKRWESVKNDAWGTIISAGLSWGTGNPSFLIGKFASFTMGRFADQIDPNGQDHGVQALKTLGGAGLGLALGGNPWDLGTALSIDLLDLTTTSEKSSDKESSLRNLGGSLVKGVLTKDMKKFVTQVLCSAAAETARKLPETDEHTPLDVRIFRAFLNNTDIHSHYIGQWVDKRFKTPPKPQIDGDLTPEEQANDPKQVFSETPDELKEKIGQTVQELGEIDGVISVGTEHLQNLQEQSLNTEDATEALKIATDKRSEIVQGLQESCQRLQQIDPTVNLETFFAEHQPSTAGDQIAIPTVQITAQPIALSLSTQVNKVHTSKADKEFVVYMQNPQGGQKQVGKFSSEASANSFVHDYSAYISRLNKINEGIAQTQSHYYSLGLDDIARELKFLEPIYNAALTEAKKLLSDDITSHEQNFHSFKKRTAQEIFSAPYYSQHVKQLEAERIVGEQQQHVGDLNAVKIQGQSLKNEIPKAEKKAKKIHDDTSNFSSRKQIGREFNAFDAIKQLHVDESSNGQRAGDIQKRIEDNNFLLQIAQGSTTTEEVNAVQRDLEQKKSAKNTAVGDLEDKSEKFQKTKKDTDHKKVKEATSDVNHTTQELDEAYNRYYALQGVDYKVEPTPAIKPPKKASGWDKTKAWINENVSASGEINVATISGPNGSQPSLVHIKTDTTPPKPSIYGEGQHELLLAGEKPQNHEVNKPSQNHSPQKTSWTFEDLQVQQERQIFEINMSFKSPPQPSVIDYSTLKDLRMQLPPTTTAQALQYGTREPLTAGVSKLPLQMAGVLPFAISKAVPEETQKKVATWVKGYIQHWKDDPIKAKKDLDVCLILGAKKAIVIAVQAFEQPSLKAKANTLTLMDVSDRCDHFVAQKLDVDLGSPNAQMGMFIGELAMPLPLVARAKPVMKVGHEALAFMRQTPGFFKHLSMRTSVVNPRMTMTRPLLIQEASVKHMSTQRAFLESINNPVYRSGIVSEGTVAKLAERNVSQIRTDWVFPQKGGATINGRWYTEHALERMAPRTPEVMAELEVRFVARAKVMEKTLPPKRFRKWYRENYPNPRGIPPSVVEAEIFNPGSTNIRVEINHKGDVITAIPGGKK